MQEALTNVQKHAQAKSVSVSLDQLGNSTGCATLQVTVEDDGVGLHGGTSNKGFGLRGLQERADQLNGRLAVESSPAGGARITMNLPVSQ